MGSQGKQIVVRPTENDNAREYHLVGEQLSELPYAEFWHPMHGTETEFDTLGPQGKQVAKLIMSERNQDEITRITFRPQSVRVYKAPTVGWPSVENNIVIPALQEVFGPKLQPVQHGSAKAREMSLA